MQPLLRIVKPQDTIQVCSAFALFSALSALGFSGVSRAHDFSWCFHLRWNRFMLFNCALVGGAGGRSFFSGISECPISSNFFSLCWCFGIDSLLVGVGSVE